MRWVRGVRRSALFLIGATAVTTAAIVVIVAARTHDARAFAVPGILRVAGVVAGVAVAAWITNLLEGRGVGSPLFWTAALGVVTLWVLPIGRWALGPLGDKAHGVQDVPVLVFVIVFGVIPAIWMEVEWRRSRSRERSAGGR
jgi:predicted outer membrane lipoprotein